MVCGNDLCEMLGLFHDLAEENRATLLKKLEELEKYKIAYNNRVRRDKKAAEDKKKGQETDDKYVIELRTANTKLLNQYVELKKQFDEMQENIDLLLEENDDKEKQIENLKIDLATKSN